MDYSEAKIYLANGEKIYRSGWEDKGKSYIKYGDELIDTKDCRFVDEHDFLSDVENIIGNDWEVCEPHYVICYGMMHSNQTFRLVSRDLDHPVCDVLLDDLFAGKFKDKVLFTEKEVDRIWLNAPKQEQLVLDNAILTLQKLRDKYEIE